MASQKATYIGVDNIMRGFDRLNAQTPYWSIWQGRNIFHQYYTDDKEAGKVEFQSIIDELDEAEYIDPITVKFHPVLSGNFITDRTPVIGTMICRVYTANGELSGISYVTADKYQYANARNTQLLDGIKAMIEPLQKEIDELKAGQTGESVSGLERYLNHPAAQQIIGYLMPVVTPHISAILGAVLPGGNAHAHAHVPAINGVSEKTDNGGVPQVELSEADEDKLWLALDRLALKMELIPDIERLANLADSQPQMFNMLLQQLRSL